MTVLHDVIALRKKLDKMSTADSADVDCIETILITLKSIPMTVDVLKQSKIALTLNTYRKNYSGTKVGSLAKHLRELWMKMWEGDALNKKKNKSNSTGSSDKDCVESSDKDDASHALPIADGECKIVILKGLMCITQRARFDITVSTENLELSGKSLNFKIPFTSIQNLFFLPDNNDTQYYFVIDLEHPLKRGKTEYKVFVFTLSRRVSLIQELMMNQSELDARYHGKLKELMQGLEHELVSTVIEVAANKKLITTDFSKRPAKVHSISCSYKSDLGLLYPLENCFIFLPKPTLHIKFEDVKNVEFGRCDGYNRSFDFFVNMSSKKSFHFSIEKEKYGFLQNFVEQRNLT